MSGLMDGDGDLERKMLVIGEEGGGVQVQDEGKGKGLGRRVWEESKKMWVVGGPAIFMRFSTFGVQVISQAFVGHISSVDLAAFALISTVFLRFSNGILLGMASALETLCGQAFGAGKYHMLGIYLQRSWIVLLTCTIFLIPIFVFTAPILRLLGQTDDIATTAGTLSLWFIPVIFAYAINYTVQMYLQAQSKNKAITYLSAVTLTTHVFLSWLFTVKLKLGINGAMGSMVFANCIPAFGQLAFVFFGGCPETWRGFSPAAFRELFAVAKLSFSSGVFYCLELWYNSILILLTGNMKNAEVEINALSVCLNVIGWEMMIAGGFMAAAGVRVANELGRGSAKDVKFAVLVVLATSLSIGLVEFVIVLLIRGSVAHIFSGSTDVAAAVAGLSPLLAFSILFNSIQPVLSGVAVGAGWQSVVAYVNVTSYYLVGIPLGLVLGYVIGLQVKGIWIGMIFGVFVQTVVLTFITWRTDWDEQVDLALNHVNRWFLPADESNNNSQSGLASEFITN